MSSVTILEFEGSTAKIHDQNLNSVLQKVGTRPFVLYSVNGAARSGKSLTLNYLFRHLDSRVKEQNLPTSKIPLPYKFLWRSGRERITTGIEIWSEPFILDNCINGASSSSSSQEIAIILMDTPGLWAQNLSAQQNAIIFAFAGFCSSVSIFNTIRGVDQLILEKLEPYGRYTSLLLEQDQQQQQLQLNQLSGRESGPFPFHSHQKLLFLVRDFPYENDYRLGHHTKDSPMDKNIPTSRNYFKDVFESSSLSSSNNKDQVQFFLLPTPNPQKNPDEDDNFRREMKTLVELLTNSDDLERMTKKVGGREVSGLEFQAHVSAFAKRIQLEGFPPLHSIQDSSGHHNFVQAKRHAVDFFKREIESFDRRFPSGALPVVVQQAHALIQTNTLDQFDQQSQGQKHSHLALKIRSEFRTDLKSELQEIFLVHRKLNKTMIERESLALKLREDAPLLIRAKRAAVKWVKCEGGLYPEKAVVGGFEIIGDSKSNPNPDQRISFVARAKLKKELIPGKLVDGTGHCRVATCWKEHQFTSYEVLVDPYGILDWISFTPSLLERAVPGGNRFGNEQLWIARVPHCGNMIPGKLHSVQPVCYVPFGGTEYQYKPEDCEILVYT